jgi:hypothetical protein
MRAGVMQILVDVPDELGLRLAPMHEQLPQILELGLRGLNANVQQGFSGLADILEFLASLPSPQEILALKPSVDLQAEVQRLIEKTKGQGLSEEEERRWQQYEYIEHLMRMAKAKALLKSDRNLPGLNDYSIG